MLNKYSGIKNLMLLGSSSSIVIFNNKNIVKSIEESSSNTSMKANRDSNLKARTTCKVLNLECKSYYNKDSIANIISLADMVGNYRVTADTKYNKAIYVHIGSTIVRFG